MGEKAGKWAFVERYCDEVYAILDAADTPKRKRALDNREIERFLERLESTT